MEDPESLTGPRVEPADVALDVLLAARDAALGMSRADDDDVAGDDGCSVEADFAGYEVDVLVIITAIRTGRLEASVVTTVGKTTSTTQGGDVALTTALGVQGLAVKATLSRLHA